MSQFQQRHYITLAKIIRQAHEVFKDNPNVTAIVHLQSKLAAVFQEDNPRFDLVRFLNACGMKEE